MTDDLETPDGEEGEAPAAAAAIASVLPTASVLESPEYKEASKQNRKLARELGSARAAETQLRSQLEEQRQAAEAQQLAAQEQAIVEILGDEGVAEWTAIAELSETNQVEAARRFKALMDKMTAQSGDESQPPAPAAVTPPAEGTPQVTPPSVPPRGVDGDEPLTPPPGNEIDELVAATRQQFDDTAKQVRESARGGRRVSMKDKAASLIGYVAGEYLRQGAKPRER